MNELDGLRMGRRQLEVEITRLESKLDELKEQKKQKDRRISQLTNSNIPASTAKPVNTFGPSLFG